MQPICHVRTVCVHMYVYIFFFVHCMYIHMAYKTYKQPTCHGHAKVRHRSRGQCGGCSCSPGKLDLWIYNDYNISG